MSKAARNSFFTPAILSDSAVAEKMEAIECHRGVAQAVDKPFLLIAATGADANDSRID